MRSRRRSLLARLAALERIADHEQPHTSVLVIVNGEQPPAEREQVIERARQAHVGREIVILTFRVKPGLSDVDTSARLRRESDYDKQTEVTGSEGSANPGGSR